MRRLLTLFTLIGAFATVAVAQPAPSEPARPAEAPTPESTTPPTPSTPSTPPTPPTPPTVVVVKDDPKSDSKPAEPPKKLQVGTEGLFQPGMLAQAWVVNESAGGNTQLSTLRLRRAEISVKGEILPKRVSYLVMFDAAKIREFQDTTLTTSAGDTVTAKQPVTAVSPLQDLAITFLSKNVDVTIGQFKIPVSWEGLNSSAKIIMPERAIISTLFGDKRDAGIKLTKQFTKWGYYAGIFNGPGLNNLDNNNQKDVALRLEAFPIKGMTIAGVTYDSIGYRQRKGTKDRWEADVRYETGPFLIQAEYIEARDVKKDKDDAVGARGFYAAFAYTIKDKALHGELQPVVRVGYVDPNTAKNLDPVADKDDELFHYDLGVNYYLKGHEMKLQGAYQRQQFDTKTANNQVILAAQVWY
jgi:hypothetical protein